MTTTTREPHLGGPMPTILDLRSQVAIDLQIKLETFQDPKKGLKLVARSTKIHEKTLKRLLKKENTPTYLTLYKLYCYLLGTTSDSQILELVPEVVKTILLEENPKPQGTRLSFDTDIEQEIASDRVFAELYYLASTGILTKEFINFKFGEYGLELLAKMLEHDLLAVEGQGIYKQGKTRVNVTPETIKRVGLQLVEKYTKPQNCDEKGENFIGILSEGLSEESYNEWLRIDWEAYYKKVELCKREGAKGPIRAFTFVTTDTFSKGKIYS